MTHQVEGLFMLFDLLAARAEARVGRLRSLFLLVRFLYHYHYLEQAHRILALPVDKIVANPVKRRRTVAETTSIGMTRSETNCEALEIKDYCGRSLLHLGDIS